MLQLTNNLINGNLELTKVPAPSIYDGEILVRNYYSVISAGTEAKKVDTARKGILTKAYKKPQEVKKVIESLRTDGIHSTYNKVMNKLDALSPLGYSSSGIVEAVGKGADRFKKGDRVACAGAGIANHAEIISVPKNLAIAIPDKVGLRDAAYTTIGSIALQGVRQADLRLVESCAVIGLGLLGQLTVQLLKASGVKAYGIDKDSEMVKTAKNLGIDRAFKRSDNKISQSILEMTNGFGVDAVIITAGTSAIDPVELAGKLCRQKGKVIIVGDVPTGFSRENYYNKELELKMSTSYGPGRYNHKYEQKGYDYPIGYVRWTENRNMEAFLDVMAKNQINIDLLTTHSYKFEKAHKAYQMITNRKESYIGIVLEYDKDKEIKKDILFEQKKINASDEVRISFIGAGSFAQNMLLPHLKKEYLVTVANKHSHSSANISTKWGFKKATTDVKRLINNSDSNILFIASYHNTHFDYIIQGLNAGKHIFVEKPICLTMNELIKIKKVYEEKNKTQLNQHLMVGFNRRFSPQIKIIKKNINNNIPLSINYRINAGFIPNSHWVQDKELGGGRIIGEVCHFIDLVMYITNSAPVTLYATAMPDVSNNMDTLSVTIRFKNGSIANVQFLSNGSKRMNKEYLEVSSNGISHVLDDFKILSIYTNSKNKKRLFKKNKGHKKEIHDFLDAIKNGYPTPIPFEEIYISTKMTFDIIESIVNNKIIKY